MKRRIISKLASKAGRCDYGRSVWIPQWAERFCACVYSNLEHINLLFIQQKPEEERHTALVCDKPTYVHNYQNNIANINLNCRLFNWIWAWKCNRSFCLSSVIKFVLLASEGPLKSDKLFDPNKVLQIPHLSLSVTCENRGGEINGFTSSTLFYFHLLRFSVFKIRLVDLV